jgi:hypothetical protein
MSPALIMEEREGAFCVAIIGHHMSHVWTSVLMHSRRKFGHKLRLCGHTGHYDTGLGFLSMQTQTDAFVPFTSGRSRVLATTTSNYIG